VSSKHSLILINENNATASDILQLAEIIENKVFEKFGIKIQKEVVII
jgi:UDP-N-acetylmuramate dehydrogenase